MIEMACPESLHKNRDYSAIVTAPALHLYFGMPQRFMAGCSTGLSKDLLPRRGLALI